MTTKQTGKRRTVLLFLLPLLLLLTGTTTSGSSGRFTVSLILAPCFLAQRTAVCIQIFQIYA